MNISTVLSHNNMKRLILSGCLIAVSSYGLNAAITKDFYKSSSVLNSGKWVKIGVDQTGVYEISYETLKQMGFSDPTKVSLYGRGGRVLPESFVSNAGVPIITDDLTAVKVLHEDEKLYFYGLGPEEISFTASQDYETGGYFTRTGNNVYTKRGYYFLTDSRDVVKMTEKSYSTSGADEVTKGVGFIYHELDSVQNTTNSGQLFWGEYIGVPNLKKRTWDVTMPNAIAGKGVMQCVNYVGPVWTGEKPIISYGFDGEGLAYCSTTYNENRTLYYAPHEPTIAPIDIPGTFGKVFISITGTEEMSDYSNLDFWVISYASNIPSFSSGENGLNQQLVALPSIEKNKTCKIDFSDPASLVVLDVTSDKDPQRLKITQQGSIGSVGVRNSSRTPLIVVFDKNKPQLKISGYKNDYQEIENQNLHSYKEEGADLIIVTTPRFLPYAEEIADLHRKHDGIKVVVATTDQLYNEFSGGTPDPMAYRSFAKMLYMSSCPPKNILLLGPLFGDFRGLQNEHDPSEGIIAYQSPSISISRGAHNINDFYGMMSDKFRTDYYERNDVQVGVGILPVKFESDAQIVVDKIRNYLEREDFAYYLNKYTAIGGIGDDHTHDIQVRDINNHIRNLDNVGTIFTPLAIDTYGNTEARKKFLNQLNEGGSMFSYFGHGAEQFLGKDKYFFNAGDVYTLRNKVHPFALFGGCQITNSDRGMRGLGETIVTSTPYGCIGSIVSGRETWSGQNYEFFKLFFTCLYTQGSTTSSAKRTGPVTIGEVYAAVKNYSTYSNELSYQLLSDPAIVIPVINRSVSVKPTNADNSTELKPGETFSFKGSILNSDNSVDNGFNGQVVVRLNEPEKVIAAGMIESKEDPKSLTFSYRDQQVTMAVADVVNGQFDIEMHVPYSISNFKGQNALLYVSAYDPSSKIGAGKGFAVNVGKAGMNSTESKDNVAPLVETLSFNNEECTVMLTVSDNVALNMSSNPLDKGLYLYIDGKERSEAHFIEPMMETSRPAYSKNVFIDGLSYGEHTARIKVKDVAGNSTEREIKFTYQSPVARYSISKDIDNSSASLTVINMEGAVPQSSTLVILSPSGSEVWRGNFNGESITWDHIDFNGDKVPAGHYKAFLIETGSNSQKGHSESIDIPVI